MNTRMLIAIFVALLATGQGADCRTRVGDRFPAIELNELKSKKKFERKSTDEKVVLIGIWSSNCDPCRLAMSQMNSLYLKHRERNFLVIGINVDENEEDISYFLDKVQIDFPLLADHQHLLAKRLDIATMPTSFIVDSDGVVRYIQKGFKLSDTVNIEKQILFLLKSDHSEP